MTREIDISSIIFSHSDGSFAIWNGFRLSDEDFDTIQSILMKYDTEGYSVRGDLEQIADELKRCG